jgi:NDP-sugar pyrophosphorylase family protein
MLTLLAAEGVGDVVLCTGFLAERVEHYCGEGTPWGVRLRYSTDDGRIGTAGAVRQALDLLPTSDPVLVVNGDTLVRLGLRALLSLHSDRHAAATILTTPQPDGNRYGSVSVEPDGQVIEFSEKQSKGPGYVNAGVYLLTVAALASIPAGGSASLERDVLPNLVGRGLMATVSLGPFADIGVPEAWDAAQTLSLADFLPPRRKRAR